MALTAITSISSLTLYPSYAIAIGMVLPPFLWFWFPLGLHGLRAILVFISVLTVFVLRVAHLRVASIHAPSAAYAFLHCCFSMRTYRALLWYNISAFVFVETYMWSVSDDKRLTRGWVKLTASTWGFRTYHAVSHGGQKPVGLPVKARFYVF